VYKSVKLQQDFYKSNLPPSVPEMKVFSAQQILAAREVCDDTQGLCLASNSNTEKINQKA
jgi:hypothetical protein